MAETTTVNHSESASNVMAVDIDAEEPPYKKLKLSLERPYKDDNGEPIPVLLDITPDGQQPNSAPITL